LDRTRNYLSTARTKINALAADFFGEQTASYRNLAEQNPALHQQIATYVSSGAQRRQAFLAMIDNSTFLQLPVFAVNPLSAIQAHREAITKKLQTLRDQDQAKELAALEQQLLELNHRVVLQKHFAEIKTYIANRIWAQKAAVAGGSTRQITMKHNDLFEKLVAKGYVKEFRQNIDLLGRTINVTVENISRKGESFRQVVLQKRDTGLPITIATPDKVLSEGEKRAVALADFLTEIKLSGPNSSIILDDPVTSLDIEWREKIASLLAKEARDRQVIVFTHDLPFLYFLKKHAEIEKVPVVNHWIRRGDEDDLPGYVFLDNSPALEKDYKSAQKAQDFYAKAKNLPATKQEDVLKQGFGALRTCYEVFVMHDLFGGVVMRFEERLSLDRLKGLVWDGPILDEVMDRYGTLSRYIEGHSHSDELFGAIKPTPDQLLNEINAFNSLKTRLKDLKRSTKI
jgi:ABC-type dipeptide/oligopeptide/nickel transport system ATPase subunit